MSEEQASGDSVAESSGSAELKQENSDTVSWTSHKKLLAEKKRRDEQLAELQSKLDAFEQKKMEGEGKKDDVIASLRKQNEELSRSVKKKDAEYSWNVVSSQIKERAIQDGCTDASKLLRLMEQEDLNAVEVDESFRVNGKDLEVLMEKAKKENPFLFKKATAPVSDLPPANAVQPGGKEVGKMSAEEIMNQLREMDGLGSV